MTDPDHAARLLELAEEFWTWRAATQPDCYDDIPRIERPPGWRADWSRAAVAARREAAAGFGRRYEALELGGEPVPVQVDGRLLGCAIARAHWELELLRGWQRDPRFYVDQALVPIYNCLLQPPPFDDDLAATVVGHLEQVPAVLEQARLNLGADAVAAFAQSALRLLDGLDGALVEAMAALQPLFPQAPRVRLTEAAAGAAAAVAGYRAWLGRAVPMWRGAAAVGPAAFGYYLHRVALLPYDLRTLRQLSTAEWDRAVAAELAVRRRPGIGSSRPAADLPELVRHQRSAELEVRRFYVERGILSQPDTLRHYRFGAMPAYLAPLTALGVSHYAGRPGHPDGDAIHYAVDPAPDLPYFRLAETRDPRAAIVHEGVHAQQLALSWAHPNPARRRFYDSVPNEGIAFYNEELMLQAGLFDDAPDTGEFVCNAMRLRALRVDVDIALAVGERGIAEVADLLAETVPMDRETAWEEAGFFAGNPGQALSYQTGKLQIRSLLAEFRRRGGDDLQAFHDRLWREGNVPLTLQRWELLGSTDHLEEADRLAATARA